jgi:hypothetical protein
MESKRLSYFKFSKRQDMAMILAYAKYYDVFSGISRLITAKRFLSDGPNTGDIIISALLDDPDNPQGAPNHVVAAERLRSMNSAAGDYNEKCRINLHIYTIALSLVNTINTKFSVSYSLQDDDSFSIELPGNSQLCAQQRTTNITRCYNQST